jgi:hypothetical protein
MANNASKFTGVPLIVGSPDAGIDVEQIRMDAVEMIDAAPGEQVPALVKFAQRNRAVVRSAFQHVKEHPTMVKVLGLAGASGWLALPVAAEDITAFGMNSTDVDGAFDMLNLHILPKVGVTVGTMPSIIIPFAFVVVLVVILFFIPELLYSMLDMLKGALSGMRKGAHR